MVRHALIAEAAAEELRRRAARSTLLEFTRYTFPSYEAVWFHAVQVWHRQAAPWLTTFEDELLCFPAGAYKDVADCIAHAAITANEEEYMRLGTDQPLLCWPPLPGSEDEKLMHEMREHDDHDIVNMPRFSHPEEDIEAEWRRIMDDMDRQEDGW
jgi:hypothetical protein